MAPDPVGSFVSILNTLGPWFGGVVAGVFLAMFLNRRVLIGYTVSHDRIGITANDNILGNVSVMVGDVYKASNLYLSRITITNRSFRDVADIQLTTYVDPDKCHLLSETSKIRDSITPVNFSDEYKEAIQIRDDDDENKKNERSNLWKMRRVYHLPAFNRGASIDITYLVDVDHGASPGIFVDTNALGVKVKYKTDPFVATHIWGIHVRHAAIAGIIFCAIFYLLELYLFESFTWIHLLAGLVLGIFAVIPGALFLKGYNYLRSLLTG